jgi:hypothetical protein
MNSIRYSLLTAFLLVFLQGGLKAQISPGELAKAHEHLEGIHHCLDCHSTGDKISNTKCLDCHKEINERITNKHGYHASAQVKGKQCVECHSDHHGKTFQIIKFDKDKFDHSLTGFELKEEHAKIKCIECHKREYIKDTPSQRKQGLTYLGLKPNCLNCHKDYHQQTLSNDCASCHGFEKFKPTVGFDHQKTDFPLQGAHQKVLCIACHKIEPRNGESFQKFSNVPFAKCTDCHEDVHHNKFGQDCLKCHNVNSFKQATKASTFDHNKTDFPLLGQHQTVDCKSCHKTSYTDPLNYKHCSDCHKDEHNGQFTATNKLSDCSDCHSNKGFSPSTYTLQKHNQSQYPLNGSHLAVSCNSCHKKTDEWLFRNIGKTCADCHKDEHAGLMDEKYYPGKKCETCHTVDTWHQPTFDHKQTDFELLGKHATESCRSCHYVESETGKAEQRFNTLADDCTTCHNDVHLGQFSKNNTTDCLRCHNNNKWEITDFDHKKTSFPLEGGHVGVACKECHKEAVNEKGKFIQYKFGEVKCSNCHSSQN